MTQISESMRYSYKAKGSQALHFDSKQFFEWATVIILLSWQFSLHGGKERSYGLNDCNCSLSIHFSSWIQMVCAHGCTVIHRCSLYTFFIMSKYSGIQIKVLSILYSLSYFKSRILLCTNTNMHSCRYASSLNGGVCSLNTENFYTS